jgi:hypothetical protein
MLLLLCAVYSQSHQVHKTKITEKKNKNTHTNTHTHTHAHTHTRIYTHTLHTHTQITNYSKNTHTYTYTHTLSLSLTHTYTHAPSPPPTHANLIDLQLGIHYTKTYFPRLRRFVFKHKGTDALFCLGEQTTELAREDTTRVNSVT